MWIADLSPYGDDEHFLAVGYLARGQAFTTGDVSVEFFTRLCQLLQNPWNPAYPAGLHLCEFCRFTYGALARFGDYTVSSVSNCELFVPGDGVIYVAPISIAHYIDAHEYSPPAEFCEAVLRCPPMRSMAYFKALLDNGARELVKNSRR